MNQIEQNIVNSFRLAKSDIIRLQNKVIELNQAQKVVLKQIERLSKKVNGTKKTKAAKATAKPSKKSKAVKRAVKTIVKRPKKVFVASKEVKSKKFHITHCPFALNIKPKSRIVFKSKSTALNKGFKPCRCVK